MDLAGDGNLDLVDLSPPAPGFYERTLKPDGAGFRPFRSLPVLDWSDPNLRFVDVTGDGIADVLITEDDAFTWHPISVERRFRARGARRSPVEEGEWPARRFRRRHAVDLPRQHDRRRARPTSCASATARSATGRTWATDGSAPRSRWTARPGSTSPICSTSAASGWPIPTAPARRTSSISAASTGRDLPQRERATAGSEPRSSSRFPAVDNLASVVGHGFPRPRHGLFVVVRRRCRASRDGSCATST